MVCHLLTCLVSVMKSAIDLMRIKCYKSIIEPYIRLNPYLLFSNIKLLRSLPFVYFNLFDCIIIFLDQFDEGEGIFFYRPIYPGFFLRADWI